MESIGLRGDFPYANPHEPFDRLFIRSKGDTLDRGAVEVSVGCQIELVVSARTISGYLADLSDAKITFCSERTDVVEVDLDGHLLAKSQGISKIMITVSRGELR